MAGWCSKRVCIRCCLSRRLLGFAVRGAQLHVVMPLCEQGSLARRIAERGAGLRAEEVAEVAVQMLEGLVELHERGIVHRDVKPTNVLVEDGGGLVLADYGLATVAERMGAPVSERWWGWWRCVCDVRQVWAQQRLHDMAVRRRLTDVVARVACS